MIELAHALGLAQPTGVARRVVVRVAAIALAGAALAGVGGPAESQGIGEYRPAINPCQEIACPDFDNLVASWSGTFKSTYPTVESTQYPQGIPGDTATVEISWSASVTVTKSQFEQGLEATLSEPHVFWTYSELSGSFTYIDNESKVNCTAKLTERPGYQSSTSDEAEVYYHTDTDTYEVYVSTPFTFQALTTGLPTSDPCEAFAYYPEPNGTTATAWDRTYEQDDSLPAGAASTSFDRPLVAWNDPSLDATDWVSSDLTISPETPASKLQIWFGSNAKVTDVTDAQTTVAIGQLVYLEARFEDKGGVESPKWTGITAPSGAAPPSGTGPDAISEYEFEDFIGHVKNLTQKQLTSQGLFFYWAHSKTYTVQVTATDAETGKEGTATATFVVEAPDVHDFSATNCRALYLDAETGVPSMVYNGPGCNGGVAFHINASAPSSTGGNFGVTQLLSEDVRHNGRYCWDGAIELTGGPPTFLDNETIYHGSFHLAAGQAGEAPEDLDLADSPSLPLPGGGSWSRLFRAVDFLMFKPDGIGSIWVALAQMEQWTFKGVASLQKGAWQLSAYNQQVPAGGSAHLAPSQLSSVPATKEPEWLGFQSAGDLTDASTRHPC